MIFDTIKLARARDDVVDDYAELLYDRALGIEIDWPQVNHAIIERWSPAGLRYIKDQAYKLVYPGAQDCCLACGWTLPDCNCVRNARSL